MPEIKISIGKMNLEQDPSSKDEIVSAILYNAYRNGKSFHRAPGLTVFGDTEAATPKSVYVYYSALHNKCLAVSGTALYTVATNGTMTAVATGAFTANTPASFVEDATRILIAANSNIHVYTVSTGVLTILAGQSPEGVTSLAMIRGFLIANGLDTPGGVTGDFGYSFDASYATWAYENNAAKADALLSILATSSNDIFMIGKESIEVNYLSGDAAIPFKINEGANHSFGTIAPHSVAYDGQNVYMLTVLGGSRQIMRLAGGRTPQLIGFPVSVPFDAIADVSGVQGFIMGFLGRSLYVLTLPTVAVNIEDEPHTGLTLAFDIRNEEWLILGDYDPQTGRYSDYRGCSFAYAEAWDNKRLVGGTDGKIYLLDDSNTYGTDVIRSVLRIGWRSHGTMDEKMCLEYAYDIKSGVGNTTVTDPVFVHRWRNNGNLEWKLPRQISMGALGQRNIPQKSRQCGRYVTRQDELIFTDAVEVVFNGLYEQVEVQR